MIRRFILVATLIAVPAWAEEDPVDARLRELARPACNAELEAYATAYIRERSFNGLTPATREEIKAMPLGNARRSYCASLDMYIRHEQEFADRVANLPENNENNVVSKARVIAESRAGMCVYKWLQSTGCSAHIDLSDTALRKPVVAANPGPGEPGYRRCAYTVAYAKCKPLVGDSGYLGCMAENNAMGRDSPEKCALADSIEGKKPAPPGRDARVQANIDKARQRQAALDERRRGEPKRHLASHEASKCLSLEKKSTYGGFINSCDYAVEYVYCTYHPKPDSWAELLDCEKSKNGIGGGWSVQARQTASEFTKGAERIHWFACRLNPEGEDLIVVADVVWDPKAKRVVGRCVKWGARAD